MVKFVGGPSVGAYKNYNNHRIAREGQFRMPRNYGTIKNETKIVIRNYNQCNHTQTASTPWYLMLPMFSDLLKGIVDLFKKPEPEPEPTPPPPPEVKVEEKVIEKPKNDPVVETPTPKPVTPEVKTEFTPEEIVNTTPEKEETIEYTVAEGKQKTITLKGKERETAIKKFGLTGANAEKAIVTKAPLWGTLAKCYGCENTPAFRNAFKAECKDLGIMEGEGAVHNHKIDQNFPKTITVDGKEYTYQSGIYDKQENWDLNYYIPNQPGDFKTYGTNEKKETKTTPGTTTKTTTWSGTTTIRYDSNKDGKLDKNDATHTVTSSDMKSKEAVQKDLDKQIKDLKLDSTLTEIANKNIFGS